MGRVNSYADQAIVGQHAFAVVPSDTVSQDPTGKNMPFRIYVGGTGNVSVTTARGETAIFSGVPAGALLPVAVRRVNVTNTTATLMLAIY